MKARYVLYAILTLTTLVALPQSVSATVYYNTIPLYSGSANIPTLSHDAIYSSTGESSALHIEFNATTTFPVNKITIKGIQKFTYSSATTTGCNLDVANCDNGWLTVWKAATSSFSTDKEYLSMTQVDISGNTLTADFDYGFYLVGGESYIFEFQPWDVNYDDSNGFYFDSAGSANAPVTGTNDGATYLWYEATQAYGTYSGVPNYFVLSLEDTAIYDSTDAPIVISEPCSTNSYTYPCTYGLATSTETVIVTGTSTLIQSLNQNSYLVSAKWISANGNIFDQQTTVIYTADNPSTFTLYMSREYLDEIAYLSEIQVCQYFDDTTFMSGYSTIQFDKDLCANIIIGSGLTTASTTALAGELGWLDPSLNTDGQIIPRPSEQEANCGITDIGCWLSKAFVPSSMFLQSILADASTTVMAVWPVGYMSREYYAYQNATTSQFSIPLNMSAFGLPTTTAAINLSEASTGVLELSDEIDDFIALLQNIFWALFWLLLAYRIYHGKNTVHHLSEA